MRRVQQDKPHARIHVIRYALDDLIGYITMGSMPPPQQNVRLGQPFFGQAVFRTLQCCRRRRHAVAIQGRRNRVVHPIGVYI